MPKLWSETVETHRAAVRDAILATTATLVAEHGLAAVRMSQIAEETGIGRATLYKYFPDVESILFAWHERHVSAHLAHLTEVRNRGGNAGETLQAMVTTYAFITFEHHNSELAALVHRGKHVDQARQHLSDVIRDVVVEAAEAGDVRADIAPEELTSYCLAAIAAASSLASEAAVHRLVSVILAGLRP